MSEHNKKSIRESVNPGILKRVIPGVHALNSFECFTFAISIKIAPNARRLVRDNYWLDWHSWLGCCLTGCQKW